VSRRPERIGIFGGTFDPIHEVHLEIARAAQAFAKLDRVLFVVASKPPHKVGGVLAGPEDRYAMTAAAVAEIPDFEASRIELDREGPSFMADTLAELRREHPDSELFLIIGEDALNDLPGWRAPEAILAQCRLLVVPRAACSPPDDGMLAGCYDYVPFEASDLSSTAVRQRLEAGAPVEDLVPAGVARIIAERGLYHGAA